MTEYHIGDPVVDLAQGRPMIVLDAPDLTVAEWSDIENYDLQGNYANSKFDPADDEPVVECVYVSDVRSEPSKSYTFPVSRVALIDAHHADDGRRVYERAVRGVLAAMFGVARSFEDAPEVDALAGAARHATGDTDLVDEALELADVEQRIRGAVDD